MITSFLPTFKQIEPDNLLGLTMGYVVSQAPVAYTAAVAEPATEESYGVTTVTKNDIKFVENGILCTFDATGKIVNWTNGKPLFIHFTEELSTVLEGRKYFAVPCDTTETYLRLVKVEPGSEWTTNIPATDTAYAAAISNGYIVAINSSATLADGTAAVQYRCIK